MDDHGTTDLMRQTLQEGLSRLRGRPVTIRAFQRDYFSRSSSFWTELLSVSLDGGESLDVFFKDLNPRHQVNNAQTIRAGSLELSYREWQMYHRVLSRERFGTPQLYASRWDPRQGLFWLFLENVGDLPLAWFGDFDLWLAAARWAARFHAVTRRLPDDQMSFLPRYDQARYRDCAERIQRKLPDLDARYREKVSQALDLFISGVDRFRTLPQSMIHGELFAKNIMIRPEGRAPSVAVIDWESAAVGPSYLDLVSLTTGRWAASKKRALWQAYFDQYQAETGHPLDWDRFCQDVRLVALYHTLKWLGWRPDWKFRHGIGRWMRELEQAMPDSVPGV